MQPVYARSHDTSTGDDHALSVESGLGSALAALQRMLGDISPRFLPNVVQTQLQAVIFADTYVKTGERLHKAGHIPHDLPIPSTTETTTAGDT